MPVPADPWQPDPDVFDLVAEGALLWTQLNAVADESWRGARQMIERTFTRKNLERIVISRVFARFTDGP